MYRNQRAEISLCILVRVEVPREAGVGVVLDGPYVLLVRRSLALAGHPHHVGLRKVIHQLDQHLGSKYSFKIIKYDILI